MAYEGHQNEVLTPPFQRYQLFSSAAEFIAPRVDVPSSRIRTRTKSRISMTEYTGEVVNHTDRAGRVKFKYSDDAIVLRPYRLAGEVADADRNDADGIEGDLDMDTTEAIAVGLNMGWEIRVRDAALTAANFTNTSADVAVANAAKTWQAQLSDPLSNFRAMIADAMNEIAKYGGVMADSLLIPPRILPALEANQIFRETLRYHQLGGINKNIIAEYLSSDGMMFDPMNIIIPRCTYNTQTETDESYDFVWNGEDILLFASAKPMQASQSPFFMATLTFEGTPVVTSRRAVDFDGDIHEGMFWQREKVYSYDRAFLLRNLL